MLKLKGQTKSGEWVEFNISQVYDICLHNNRWCIEGYPNDYVIDTTTIQPADDPCKASDSQVSTLREQVKVLREALGWLVNEMDCRDGEFGGCLFTRQDFKIARNALEQTNPKDAERC